MFVSRQLACLSIAVLMLGTRVATADLYHARNQKFAAAVDLSSQLPDLVREQEGGNCHVHAAIDLVEAACFRKLGKHVRLSPSYLTYRHLREKLATSSHTFDSGRPRGNLTASDGGVEGDTLDRVLAGDVLTKEEGGNDEEFFEYIRSTVDDGWETAWKEREKRGSSIVPGAVIALPFGVAIVALAKLLERPSAQGCMTWTRFLSYGAITTGTIVSIGALLGHVKDNRDREALERQLTDAFLDDLDAKAKARFDARSKAATGNGYKSKSQDAALKECLAGLRKETTLLDAQGIIARLRRGNPVGCGGHYNFPSASGGHAAMIVGYAPDPAAPGGFRFLVRNNHGRPPDWFYMTESGCRETTTVGH